MPENGPLASKAIGGCLRGSSAPNYLIRAGVQRDDITEDECDGLERKARHGMSLRTEGGLAS